MGLSRLTPRQLEAFVTAARVESFGEAASRLSLTPSAVSQLVAELESTVGFRLFDRTTRRVSLSAAGRDLLGAAEAVLSQLDTVERVAADLRSRAVGMVRVAAPLALASTVLPPIIDEFMGCHPRATVQVCDVSVDQLVECVAQAEADLALGPDRVVSDDVQREDLFSSPWMLWCSPDHVLAQRDTVAWADLRCHPLVAAGRDHERGVARMGQQWPEAERVVPLQVVDHVTTAFGLSAGGRMATLAPAYVARLAEAFGLVPRRVHAPEVMRQVCLYRPTRRSLAPVAQAFADHLDERLRDQFTGSTALT